MTGQKLKPCPFCGSSDAVSGEWENDGGSLFVGVQCCDCGAEFALPVQWDQDSIQNRLQEALDKWNTRHTPPEVQALIRRAVEAEREACAQVADKRGWPGSMSVEQYASISNALEAEMGCGTDVAAAIRKRGEG